MVSDCIYYIQSKTEFSHAFKIQAVILFIEYISLHSSFRLFPWQKSHSRGKLCMFDIQIPFLIQPLEGNSFPDGIEPTTFHLTSEWVEDKNIKRYVGLK